MIPRLLARRSPRAALSVTLAVAALLGQALLPHVHVWQSGGEHDAPLCIVHTDGHARIAATERDDARHDRAACPTCQALAHSRHLGAPPPAMVLVAVGLRGAAPAPYAPPIASYDIAAPAAPRAPPALA